MLPSLSRIRQLVVVRSLKKCGQILAVSMEGTLKIILGALPIGLK